LDQFFNTESVRAFNMMAEQANWRMIDFGADADVGYRPERCMRPPELMPGWGLEKRSKWSRTAREHFSSTVRDLEIALPAASAGVDLGTHVSTYVRNLIEMDPSRRSSTARFALDALLPDVDEGMMATLADAGERLWDGVRRLPVPDSRVAAAVGNLVALGHEQIVAGGDLKKAVEHLFGAPIVVEFMATDKSYSRSVVARSEILTIVRNDIADLLIPDLRNRVTEVETVLDAVFNPARLFDFDEFERFFLEQVVPAQVLFRGPPLLASPADLVTFGRP
jgi:hypothetical protein